MLFRSSNISKIDGLATFLLHDLEPIFFKDSFGNAIKGPYFYNFLTYKLKF